MNSTLEQDWVRFFHSGLYREGWEMVTPNDRTSEEIKGILRLLKPTEGSHILDWCGGFGRHAIKLAQRGYKVTLLDYAPNHIKAAQEAAAAAWVRINTVEADFRETPEEIQADYALNLFSSGLGYLTELDDIRALLSLLLALKPGAKVLIDTMNLLWLVRNFKSGSHRSSPNQRLEVREQRHFDPLTNRNHMHTTYLINGAKVEVRDLSVRVYSPKELADLVEKAGFKILSLHGGFDGSQLTFNSQRIVLICQKPLE